MAKKKPPRTAGEAATKGKLVEFIVAAMHQSPGVKVERNVKLSAFLRRKETRVRKREIDVLITARVANYPIRIGIECKNFKKIIGVGLIGQFIDHLNDVGIPLQHSVYVTTWHFTQGAIE